MPKWLRSIPQIQHRLVNFAVSAYFHLLFPVSLDRALADRSVDEPAKVSGIKLPCGAILPVLRGTTARQPAGLALPGSTAFQCQNKKDLALDIYRNVPPALFETLNGFRRNAQDLRHLALRFFQMPANCRELDSFHFRLFLLGFISYHNVGTREPHFPPRLHFTPTRKPPKTFNINLTIKLLTTHEAKFIMVNTTLWYSPDQPRTWRIQFCLDCGFLLRVKQANFARSPGCSTVRRAPSVIAEALDTENPARRLHAERVSCWLSVGRKSKKETTGTNSLMIPAPVSRGRDSD